jgi:hypothetical protein
MSALRTKPTNESQFETPTSLATFPMQAHGARIGALADLRLQSSLRPNAPAQQQPASNSNSTLLNALDLLNSQSSSNKSNANPVVDQNMARSELLQRLISLSTGNGNTSTPLQLPLQAAQQVSPSVGNGSNGDLNTLLLSLLNANNSSSQTASSAFAPSAVSNGISGLNVQQQQRGSPSANAIQSSSSPLHTNLMALLGQSSMNSSTAGSLIQLLASQKNVPNNTQAVDFLASLVSNSAASNQMIPNARNEDPTRRDLLRLIQQQQQDNEPTLNRGGNFDVASMLRQQGANDQFKTSNDLAVKAISEFSKSVMNISSGPPANTPLVNSSDFLTLLKLHQQRQNNEQQPGADNFNSGNNTVQNGVQNNVNEGVDVNALTNILSKQNAALLLKLQMQSSRQDSRPNQPSHPGNQTQGFQVNASSGFHHQQCTGNPVSAETAGNAGLQYLQQLMGVQASLENMNNTNPNNQLEAVLRALANSNNQQQNQNQR